MRIRLAAFQGFQCALIAALLCGVHVCVWADTPKSAGSAVASDVGILGFQFAKSDKHGPEVVEVFADTPTAKADLKQGDIILEINGAQTKDLEERLGELKAELSKPS